jgi:non-heme chloroperoxidase
MHGWPLSSDSWDSQAFALAEAGYKVIFYDRRGFGRSEQPWNGYDYSTLADDLSDVLTATGAQQDITLIGFSMGGGEVARYCSKYASKGIIKCGLISSIVPYMFQTPDNPNGLPKLKMDEISSGIKKDRPNFMRSFLTDFFGQGILTNTVSNETIDWAWEMCMQAGLKPTLKCAESFGTTDFRSELSAINVPTLIIHGTADKTVPIDAAGREATKMIKNNHYIEYDGAPHGLFVSHSERLTNDLIAFMKT